MRVLLLYDVNKKARETNVCDRRSRRIAVFEINHMRQSRREICRWGTSHLKIMENGGEGGANTRKSLGLRTRDRVRSGWKTDTRHFVRRGPRWHQPS